MIDDIRNGVNYSVFMLLFTCIVAMIKIRTKLEKYDK